MDILTYLVKAPISRGRLDLTNCTFSATVDRALWGGFHADRIAYAFMGGYAAALARLVAQVPTPARPFPLHLCMAATEKSGNSPKAIATSLRTAESGDGFVLNGVKTFATYASLAEEMLVVASRGASDGKNSLVLVRVAAKAPGVSITDKPALAFAPELPHAIVSLENVAIPGADVLPGDGYSAYLKPFRTIEDTHVLAATIGYAIGAAREHGFEVSLVNELLNAAESTLTVGERPPTSPLTHLLLEGVTLTFRRIAVAVSSAMTDKAPEAERARWERDQPILAIGDGIRVQRTASALAGLLRE